LGEKLAVFIEFKEEILRTKVLRMTVKRFNDEPQGRVTLDVILSEAKNLLLLMNFPSDVYIELIMV
jgi:hypothetical protein